MVIIYCFNSGFNRSKIMIFCPYVKFKILLLSLLFYHRSTHYVPPIRLEISAADYM